MDDTGLMLPQHVENGGRRFRGCVQHQVVLVDRKVNAGRVSHPQGLGCAHRICASEADETPTQITLS